MNDTCKPNPNKFIMGLRFLLAGLGGLVGLMGMVRERKWKAIGVWVGCLVLLASILRYLICASCSGYGDMCYSYYLGKYTSKVFPRREKDVPRAAMLTEGIVLSLITYIPALVMRKDRKNLILYLSLMEGVMLGQFFHACHFCASHSNDEWKKACPVYKTWKAIGK